MSVYCDDKRCEKIRRLTKELAEPPKITFKGVDSHSTENIIKMQEKYTPPTKWRRKPRIP